MPPENPRRVLIADDHPVARLGTRIVVSGIEGVAICGEASSPEEVLRLAGEHRPDAAVLDLCMGGRDGLDLIGDLADLLPGISIVVYTSMDEALYARRAFRAGARGYVSKGRETELLASTLRTVLDGGVAANLELFRIRPGTEAGGTAPVQDLSNRELEVFRLIGLGLSPAAIAERLGVSAKTVSSYRERIKSKLALSGTLLDQAAYEFARTSREVLPPESDPD